MGLFYGKVGYGITSETSPGVWTTSIKERYYRGRTFRDTTRWQKGEDINDNLNVTTEVSILADPFLYNTYKDIKYVDIKGTKWKVRTIHINRPRVRLSLGGVYNETES